MVRDLVFDVGMNNGDDAAHYLSKGYRVVAVEADPTLVEQARERFQEPIRRGQLELVNAAIGPKEEIAQFWVCDTKREWNSFDRNVASRYGLPLSQIPVLCRPFRDLLRQYGTPFYLKVDIEGHDHYCVDDLDRADLPQYISVEMGPLETVFKLGDLGYERFKLITQNYHTCLAIDVFGTRERVRRQLRRVRAGVKRQLRPYPGLYRVGQRLSRIGQTLPFGRSLNPVHPNRKTADPQQFPPGSSGPFGEETDGSWQTLSEVAYTWVAYRLGHSRYGPPSLDVWHDVHAARPSPESDEASGRTLN